MKTGGIVCLILFFVIVVMLPIAQPVWATAVAPKLVLNSSSGGLGTPVIGVQSKVTLSTYAVSDSGSDPDGRTMRSFCSYYFFGGIRSCFTIQQNFYVKTPDGSRYWVQNIIRMAKDISEP